MCHSCPTKSRSPFTLNTTDSGVVSFGVFLEMDRKKRLQLATELAWHWINKYDRCHLNEIHCVAGGQGRWVDCHWRSRTVDSGSRIFRQCFLTIWEKLSGLCNSIKMQTVFLLTEPLLWYYYVIIVHILRNFFFFWLVSLPRSTHSLGHCPIVSVILIYIVLLTCFPSSFNAFFRSLSYSVSNSYIYRPFDLFPFLVQRILYVTIL